MQFLLSKVIGFKNRFFSEFGRKYGFSDIKNVSLFSSGRGVGILPGQIIMQENFPEMIFKNVFWVALSSQQNIDLNPKIYRVLRIATVQLACIAGYQRVHSRKAGKTPDKPTLNCHYLARIPATTSAKTIQLIVNNPQKIYAK